MSVKFPDDENDKKYNNTLSMNSDNEPSTNIKRKYTNSPNTIKTQKSIRSTYFRNDHI